MEIRTTIVWLSPLREVSETIKEIIKMIPPITRLNSKKTKAEKVAEDWAMLNEIEVVHYLPNYKVYGISAEMIRDKRMIEESDCVILVVDNLNKIPYEDIESVPLGIRMVKRVNDGC